MPPKQQKSSKKNHSKKAPTKKHFHKEGSPRTKSSFQPPSSQKNWGSALEKTHKLLESYRNKGPLETTDKGLLDPWQQDTVDALTGGANVIIDAPTTAGKTRAVEEFFRQNLDHPDFRACYTCPVKSLTNDKLREFRALYGKENVGISTGDLKENLDAPIVVATLESYRNSLLGVEPDMRRQLVVFDEYHYLHDSSRGSAWEEALILTPPSCQTLLLSASVANPEEFATWLEQLFDRPCIVLQVEKRPVPLQDLVWVDDHWILGDEVPRKKRIRETKASQSLPQKITVLHQQGLTPGIVYAGTRRDCEELAFAIAEEFPPLEKDQCTAIKNALDKLHSETQCLGYMPSGLHNIMTKYGVGYHHSGLTPMGRVAVESLVKQGLLNICTATMGLSLGINFSVRSSLISDLDRPGEDGFTRYTATDVLQMNGRAGRRGRDAIGYTCWPTLKSWQVLGQPRREICRSQLKIDPATFLGLIGSGYTLERIERFYDHSFFKLQRKQSKLRLATPKYMNDKLGAPSFCGNPTHEITRPKHQRRCTQCPQRTACIEALKQRSDTKQGNPLGKLHRHLHKINALDEKDQLTDFGSLARYFPQPGGLYVADLITSGELHEDNLMEFVKISAALSLASYKKPQASRAQLLYKKKDILFTLSELYPLFLFPSMYDFQSQGHHWDNAEPEYKEFNEKGSTLAEAWLMETPWEDMVALHASPRFAGGDMTGLIYRSSSWLQSLAQAKLGPLSDSAARLRQQMLRPPVAGLL
ncbi:MAG: DEAD/DEAH box helicase [Oligoflexales bacterium]